MSWREWHAARQFLSEERLGTLVRQKQADEDTHFRSAASRLPK